jgi:enoyl-CoA hydratase/carnithine racemase
MEALSHNMSINIFYPMGRIEMIVAQQLAAIDRRALLVAGGSFAGLGAAVAAVGGALAQAGPPPSTPASEAAAAPGKVALERLPGGMLMIGIDRPLTHNRIDPAILIGLGKAYYQLDHDETLRVAVLHGIGPDFVIGLDVAAFAAATAAGVLPPKDDDFINPLNLTQPRAKPVVVAMQGAINSVGHELALAADIRIAASDSQFAQLEVNNAVFPAGGATVRFTREAGWGNAMRYMLTGEKFGAEEAFRMGLVQEVVPAGKQLDRAVEIAKKIASLAPLGVQAVLASSHQAVASEDAALRALQPQFQKLLRSDDSKEARAAQQEHRAPVFHGR